VPIEQIVAAAARQPSRKPALRLSADALVYVLHTSGSTGRPKGAMLSHRGIVNCIAWMQQRYRLGADDRFLYKTSLNFDPSVWEIFWPLISGGAVVIAPQDAGADPASWRELMLRHRVSSLYAVPALLDAWLEQPGLAEIASLRRVICGGEKLSLATIARFRQRLGCALHHSYGPTETSIAAAEWTVAPNPTRVALGRPLGNVRLYVLDRAGEPVPQGAAGELGIGGDGVGIGYARRPDLTAERFVPDRFALEPGRRLYLSGDRVRYWPDGQLEFLGRRDDQIKLRGNRIEPGEIERVLQAHDAVAQAVVMLRADPAGDNYLAAYVVPHRPVTSDALRDALRANLPEAMVPAAIVLLDALPLAANGKIDRNALPDPQRAARAAPVPPLSEAERRLAAIWRELFGRELIGVHDDFFELGGHSLLATRMLARLNEALDADLPLRQVFELRSIAQLARAAEAAPRRRASPAIPRAPRRAVRIGAEPLQQFARGQHERD
jgi:amino acid adenylation domain-containing protein